MSTVKPAFGPALPALLRRRGIPVAATIAGIVLLIALLGFVMVAVRPGADPGDQFLHRTDPQFNLLYEAETLALAAPRGDELVRLEGRGRRQEVAVSVRPLALPPFRGDVAHGLLPAFATGHIDRLRATFPGFRLEEEGRARVNDAPGYEVTFSARPGGGRVYGSDVLVLPAEDVADGALVLSLRRSVRGRGPLGAADRRLSYQSRRAFRSFRYGLERG